MSSLNARAPTDLHSQREQPSSLSSSSASILPTISYDEDAPDDEQSHHLSIKSTSSNNSNNSSQYKQKQPMSSDVNDIDLVSKKKKIKDRPWKKAKEYDSILTSEEDVNVIGVSSVVSPTAANGENYSDSDDDSHFEKRGQSGKTKLAADDDFSFDDVSSRWSNQRSTSGEVRAANNKAVGLAATKLAEKYDNYDEEDDDNHDDDDFEDNVKLSTTNDLATPQKQSDHTRVRMEALNLLNLANNKDSIGGYLVKNDSIKHMKVETSMSPNRQNQVEKGKNGKVSRVQSALQGMGVGMGIGLEKRSRGRNNYDKFTLDKMEYDEQDAAMETVGVDVDDVENVTMEEMEYGQTSPAQKKRSAGTWGSRYSIDRHMMALHGGLSTKQVLSNMDRDHYNALNKNKGLENTSATNLYKTSPHEDDARWNVASGARSSLNGGDSRPRLWNTWIATMKDTMAMVMDKISVVDKKNTRYANDNPHATLGSHRRADHSSSPKGIFTGLAVTQFLDKLSPRSRSDAERKLAGGYPDDDVNFSATDDYIYDQKLRRKRMVSFLLLLLVGLAALVGIVVGVSKGLSRSGEVGASYMDVGEKVQFYVTSDVPFNTADETKLSRELAELSPENGEFLIHLGDVGDASVNMCTLGVYQDAAALLKESPVPVFVLPGNNDWNDCPDPRSALSNWMDELNRFEENFVKDDNDGDDVNNLPLVRRQLARNENFSFLHKGVLFIAFHLVDGRVQSESEWSLRIAQDVAWMDEVLNVHGVEEYRAIVIMAHAAPTPKIGDFIWPMKESLSKIHKPVLYLHANDGGGMLKYTPYPEELPRFTVVRMEKGYIASPTQITIEHGPRPFRYHTGKTKLHV